METEIISVHTHTDQEEAARLFSKYDFLALPVLDADGLMVGIITVDDAIDVVVDEATEDMTVMAAVTPSEKSYFDTSVFAHAKNRMVAGADVFRNNYRNDHYPLRKCICGSATSGIIYPNADGYRR